jgi:integrase/recombinase XerD
MKAKPRSDSISKIHNELKVTRTRQATSSVVNESSRVTNLDLIQKFERSLIRKEFADVTIRQYKIAVQAFERFVGGSLLDVDGDILEEYIDYQQARGIKRSSIVFYFAALSTFYEFLSYKGYTTANPVLPVRRQNLRQKSKKHDISQRRQCITDNQARDLILSINSTRDKAIVILLLKTGMRRHELAELTVDDIDMVNRTIRLHPTGKRTNEIVFFDKEAKRLLGRWLRRREKINKKNNEALFLDKYSNNISAEAVGKLVQKHAEAIGLHDPKSRRLDRRFSAHCCRHWFSTRLDENGMPISYLKELRGDDREAGSAVGGYIHIDMHRLKKSYDELIPILGV